MLFFGGWHAVGEGDGEGVEGGFPSCNPSCLAGAFRVKASHCQVEDFHGGLLVGEVASGPDRAAEPSVH